MWLGCHFVNQTAQDFAVVTCLFKSYHQPGKQCCTVRFHHLSCCGSYCLKTNLQVWPKIWWPGLIIMKEKLVTNLSCCPSRIGEWWKCTRDRFFLFSLASLFGRQIWFFWLLSVGSSALTRSSLHWLKPRKGSKCVYQMTKLVILIHNYEKHRFAFAFWNILCFLSILSCCFYLEQHQTHKSVACL